MTAETKAPKKLSRRHRQFSFAIKTQKTTNDVRGVATFVARLTPSGSLVFLISLRPLPMNRGAILVLKKKKVNSAHNQHLYKPQHTLIPAHKTSCLGVRQTDKLEKSYFFGKYFTPEIFSKSES